MAPQRNAGLLVWQDTKQWVSEWISDGSASATWRDPNTGTPGSVEHYSLREGAMMLDGFDQWPIACLRADLVDINSGETVSLTCDKGHPYAPFLIPRDPWRMRIWGVIANSVRFYWEGDFYPDSATDPCYFSGPITRDVIREQEVWWDSNGGWVRGTGTPVFDAQGKPISPSVTKQSETLVAKGEGVIGLKDLASGRQSCLYSRWQW